MTIGLHKEYRTWTTGLAALAVCVLLAACAPNAPRETVLATAVTPETTVPAAGPTRAPAASIAPTTTAILTATPAPRQSSMPLLAPSPTPAQRSTLAATVAPRAAIVPTVSPSTVAASLEHVRFALAPLVERLAEPVFVTHAGDGSGRLFIVEKPGVIRILKRGGVLGAPFLDIRDRVGSGGSEQGLLGLAFAPDYPASGYLFVNYTDRQGDTVIARFSVGADPDIADASSAFEVILIDQPAANHNGGMLAFGPDGYLWIGTGDGGAANDRFGNGQNPRTLLGKMLRVDVTTDPSAPYLIPADNPWVKANWNGQDVRDEVWAVGLRNPWRYSFDRVTGDLWIADVGQNRYEEVNRVAAGSSGGLNFGWPIMEGTRCFPEDAGCARAGMALPAADYAHGANGCSITGGYVYRGAQYPVLNGVYLYGDYCSGKIWGLVRAGAGWRSVELLDSSLNISSFGEDERGELYVTDLRGGLYRVVVE